MGATTECKATLHAFDDLFYIRKYGKTGVQGLGWRMVYYKTGTEFLQWEKNGEKKYKCTTQVENRESERLSHDTFLCTIIAKEVKTAK